MPSHKPCPHPTPPPTLTRVREGDLNLVELVPDLPNLVSLGANDGAVEALVDVDVALLLVLHLGHQLLKFLWMWRRERRVRDE